MPRIAAESKIDRVEEETKEPMVKSGEQREKVKLKKRENKGLKRGRKPKDAHLYISESLVKISLWTR